MPNTVTMHFMAIGRDFVSAIFNRIGCSYTLWKMTF